MAWLSLSAFAILQDITVTDIQDQTYRTGDLAFERDGKKLILAFQDSQGANRRISADEIVEIALRPFQTRPEGGLRAVFTNGDVLHGSPLRSTENGLELQTLLGPMEVEFYDLRRVENARYVRESRQPRRREVGRDWIVLLKDDMTEHEEPGTLMELGPAGISYRTDGGPYSYPIENFVAVWLDDPPADRLPKEPSGLYAIVTLTDQSILRGEIAQVERGEMKLTTWFRRSMSIPLGKISSIHFRNGRVVYLSDLPCKAEENADYIQTDPPGEPILTGFEYKRDASVMKTPLRMRGTEYKKGIGVHSRSVLEFQLGGQYSRFLAVIGLDDTAQGGGDVIFEVQVDGRVGLPATRMRGADEPLPISVDVQGAQVLRLIVDFGEDGNTLDRANWAAARLVK